MIFNVGLFRWINGGFPINYYLLAIKQYILAAFKIGHNKRSCHEMSRLDLLIL